MRKIIIVIACIIIPAATLLSQEEFILNKASYYKVSAAPGVAVPVGRLGILSDVGYGTILGISYCYGRIDPGILAGLYYFKGTEEMTDSLTILPVLAAAGYTFTLPYRLFLRPRFAAGVAVIILRQDQDNISFYEEVEYETKISVDAMMNFGLMFGYRISTSFWISVLTEYSLIVEISEPVHFITFGIDALYKF